ncbi:MAG: thiolase family protein [Actinomycetota bacterium]|nr:thiolase family protein [Actinomycetota bacterium]
MQGRDVYVADAVRTPIGKHGGALAGVRPDDLAAHVVRALVDRAPALDPRRIDEVIFGDANQAGEDNRNVARMAALLAGLPTTVPGSTVNRLCASGLDAVLLAARTIAVGDASVLVAGGVESMSRAPWVLPKPARGYPRGDETLYSTTLGWRMVNPRMPAEWTVSLGEGAEILAERYGISRDEQDAFALRSHERAAVAWKDGVYDDEVVQVPGAELDRDEGIRDGLTLDTLAQLKPVFRADGTVTAGNSSQLSDGAATLLLVDEDRLAELGTEPLARISASGVDAVEPQLYGIGPVRAVRRALDKGRRRLDEVAVLDLNEAFAAQVLACVAEWPGLDRDAVNPRGGSIAMGHPLGCSGARLVGSLAWQLRQRGSGTGVAALCIGVGQGLAVVMER